MANDGARVPVEQENPAVPPPLPREILIGSVRVSVPQENPTVPPPPPPREIPIAGARVSLEQENPAVPPSPTRQIAIANPPPRPTAPGEIQSLVGSFRSAVTLNPPPRFNAPRNLAQEIQSLTNSLRSLAPLTRQETDACMQSIFDLMTSSEEGEEAAAFGDMISRLHGSDLGKLAWLLTLYSDLYFMQIAVNQNGSKRLNKLFGKSEDADTFFFASISRRFVDVMTDKHASNVVIGGIRGFRQEKKMAMWRRIHHHAVHVARDPQGNGCIAINFLIEDAGDCYCRNQLIGIVVLNALLLSHDAYGNFVVQHLLNLNDVRLTSDIAVRLRGHFVELSFRKQGSFIVEKLLKTEASRVMVVEELLRCEGHELLRLARSQFGNFVVGKALRITQEEVMVRADLFWGLVHKLMPFLNFLRGLKKSRNIAHFLESIV